MAKIDGSVKITDFLRKVSERMKQSKSFEGAAQVFNSLLYEEYRDSIVLTRTFATVPFVDLPQENKQFVTGLAEKTHVSHLLGDNTLVLTLVGTRGSEPDWNNRKTSRGHVGIPLVSSGFIEEIPMVSRLLKELGSELDWIDSKDSEIIARTIGSVGGIFYVEDAKTTVDKKNRKIIAAQDFVSHYDVKTVFGLGGGYVRTPTFAVNINFLRDTIDKNTAERFMPIFNQFKIDTSDFVWKKQMFV